MWHPRQPSSLASPVRGKVKSAGKLVHMMATCVAYRIDPGDYWQKVMKMVVPDRSLIISDFL